MSAETETVHWLMHAILVSYAGVITWLGKGVYSDVEKLKNNSHNCTLDLANFRTAVANNYVKEESMQNSLARVHDRIDEANKSADSNFRDLRSDISEIKNILIKAR